uniref:hypothetical protein n=2 Tax=Enterococcus casseliflavus TaxID=37734 RepID=UPI001CF816BF|nr:hypothetical protein [Enterococcus casseliflavus]
MSLSGTKTDLKGEIYMEINAVNIKKSLREQGIDTKKVRIRVEMVGYGSTSIKVKLHDLSLETEIVRHEIQKRWGSIRYDEKVQGEILEGCNTYVFCDYDDDVIEQEIQARYSQAEFIYQHLEQLDTHDGEQIFETETMNAVAFFKNKTISLMMKDRSSAIQYRKHTLNSVYDLAHALVFLETIGHFGKL